MRLATWSGAVSSPTSVRVASRASQMRQHRPGLLHWAGWHLGHGTGRQAHRRRPVAGAGRQVRVWRARLADVVLLRAHFGLHAARQGPRQSTSMVPAARAVISRRKQRLCPEPIGSRAEQPPRREHAVLPQIRTADRRVGGVCDPMARSIMRRIFGEGGAISLIWRKP